MADITYFEAGYIDRSYFTYVADAQADLTVTSSINCEAAVSHTYEPQGQTAGTRPRIVSTYNNPQFSTSIYKWGTASLQVSGNNGISIQPSNDFATWTTIDTWIRISETNSLKVIAFYDAPSLPGNGNWSLAISGDYLTFTDPGAGATYFWANNRLTPNAFNHIRLVRSGTTITLWINGVQTTPSYSEGTIRTSYSDTTGSLYIGTWSLSNPGSSTFYIDDFFVTNYTITGGTIPLTEWKLNSQSNVEMLFHFNQDYVDDTSILGQVSASLSSHATLTANIGRLTNSGTITLTSTSTLTAIESKLDQFSINLTSQSTQTTITNRIRKVSANLLSQSSVIINAVEKENNQAQLSAQSSITINANRIRQGNANLTAFASEVTIGIRIEHVIANLQSNTSLTANIVKFNGTLINCRATSSMAINSCKIANAISHLQSQFILTGNLNSYGTIKQAQINLSSYFTETVYINKSHIDTTLSWVIPYEDRDWAIATEI